MTILALQKTWMNRMCMEYDQLLLEIACSCRSVVQVTSGASDQWCEWPVVWVTSGVSDQWCEWPVVQWPVVRVTSGVTSGVWPVVRVTSGASDQWCEWPVVRVTSGDQWCKWPVRVTSGVWVRVTSWCMIQDQSLSLIHCCFLSCFSCQYNH